MFDTINIPQFEGKEAASALHALICLAASSYYRRNPEAAAAMHSEILAFTNMDSVKLSEPLRFYLQSIAGALSGNMIFTPDFQIASPKPYQ